MVMRIIHNLLLVLLIGFFGTKGVLAEVTSAFVDRTTINEGDTIKLVIDVKKSGNEPDLTPLQDDFDVLSQSNSSRINIINGRMDSTNEWIIILSPKHTGKLVIPPLKVGAMQTEPITIKVNTANTATPNSDIFLEATIDPEQPYVQSQLIYTVRLYQGVDISSGSLSEPHLDNAIVERLGDDLTFNTVKNGRRYHVTERRYAIFPQASGDFTIPATVFSGQAIVADRGRSVFDQFFNQGGFNADPFGNPFQTTKPLRARSPEIKVNVLPQPKQANGAWWLPAQDLSLTEQWSPNPPVFHVGDSVTRTITLQAKGLTAAQLPDIPENDTADLKRYPDQPVKKTSTKGTTVKSIKVQKIALVPTKAGQVTFPEISIPWWDTKENKAKIATLPARTFTVLPAEGQTAIQNPLPAVQPGTTAKPDTSESNSNQAANDKEAIAIPAAAPVTSSNYWRWIALLLFTAWLVTLIGWYRLRRMHSARAKDQAMKVDTKRFGVLTAKHNAFKQACMTNDPKKVKAALLDWASLLWPEKGIYNLTELAAQLSDQTAKDAIAELDRVLYSNQSSDWNGDHFWTTLSKTITGEKKRAEQKQNLESPLQELYSTQ